MEECVQNCTGEEWKQVPRSRTEACHAFPEGNLVIKQTQIFSLAMFLLCACCSDEQIEGGWGGGGGRGRQRQNTSWPLQWSTCMIS